MNLFSDWERERLIKEGRAVVDSTSIYDLQHSGGRLAVRRLAAAHEEIQLLRSKLGVVTQERNDCRDHLAKSKEISG